ncbi:MAG TPA: hypothetical protein VG900_12600 [Hyphomicrobiaceae bacterium]|nr:hypothetical protein [Hyphomicrobiaceae bacterium]
MTDPQVVNTLRAKAENLQGYIAKLEADLEQARADLSHVVATLHLFEAPDADTPFPMHYNLDRLFKRREIGELCHKALADGPKSTRELADWIIAAKGFPAGDRHLRTSVAYRVVQALRMQEKRGGRVTRAGKLGGALVWKFNG